VLAGIVFVAVYKLVDIRALLRMWRVSRYRLLCRAYRAGVGPAAWDPPGCAACRPRVHFPAAWPGVAAQHCVSSGGFPGTGRYSDSARHEGVEPLVGVIAFRPEASLLYINAETILDAVFKDAAENA
jgi:hypothetical protein